jgi:hypothetical protein
MEKKSKSSLDLLVKEIEELFSVYTEMQSLTEQDFKNFLLLKAEEVKKIHRKESVDLMKISREHPDKSPAQIYDEKFSNPLRWRCNLCGRDKFTRKSPHRCNSDFRKRGIDWEIFRPES